MKKIMIVLLMTACCVLPLTACSNVQETAPAASQQMADSFQSNKILTGDTNGKEKRNPLTPEQVQKIVEDSASVQGTSNARRDYIVKELNKIQEAKPFENDRGERNYTYYLFDENGQTNNTVEINYDLGTVCCHQFNDSGALVKEEVLYNWFTECDTGELTLEKVQQLVDESEAEALKAGYIYQSEYIYDELNKLQECKGIFLYWDTENANGVQCYSYILPSHSADSIHYLLLRYPNHEGNNLASRFQGDTVVYVVEKDVHGGTIEQKILYSNKYENYLAKAYEQGVVSAEQYEQMKPRLSETQQKQLKELDALAQAKERGEFVYQKALVQNTASPDMHKVTADEVRSIIQNMSEEANIYYIPGAIESLQAYPDARISRAEPTFDFYYYWPDANTIDERRQEIVIDIESETVTFYTYDDNGTVVSTEVLYDAGKS